ncbi:putative B3 domain-containing protein [Rosa sericea]
MVAAYEEARNKRLEENKKKFQDLGITQVSKTLSDLTASEKKPQQRAWKPKAKNTAFEVEPRRSTRQRNPIQTYVDDVDIGLPTRKRLRSSSSSFGSYLARPLEECRMASYEERSAAFKAAERLQESLQSENPSFVKSMVRSHVYSCFWLGLPSNFCETHLPKSSDSELILEDEDGNEYDAKYIAKRTGLSGGWRGFALEHKLDDGDALVFELVEPTRFKIHIIKVTTQEHCKKDKVKGAGKPSKAAKKPDRDSNQKQRSKRATTPEIIDMKTPPELLPESPKSEAVLPYRLRKRA